MDSDSVDIRANAIVQSVQGLESPQETFAELVPLRLRRHGDIVSLFNRDDIVKINRHPSVLGQGGSGGTLGAERPTIPNETDGAEHKMWRHLLDPMFSTRRIQRFEGAIRRLAGELIDTFIDDGEVELCSRFCTPLPAEIFVDMLGAPREDLQFFIDFNEGIIRPAGTTLEEIMENVGKAGARMVEYVHALVAERRKNPTPRDDMIGEFLAARIDGEPLSDLDLHTIIYTMLLAGLDTVGSTFTLVFAWLARHPDERQKLIDDASLLPGALEDIMRYQTPVPTVQRYATEDIDLGGGEVIKAGDQIQTMLASANLDPDAFPEPMSVDFQRGNRDHLVFASGTHRCLGAALARLELRVAVEEFHRRIPNYWVKPGDDIQYNNITIRRAYHLPLAFERAGG
jgi:cytochrome P450